MGEPIHPGAERTEGYTRRTISLDEKIENAEAAVLAANGEAFVSQDARAGWCKMD